MDHCDNCTKGVLAKGTPTGTVTKFAGVDTYIARPAEKSTKAILMASDAFGYSLLNNRLVADSFAKETGFLTIIPDLFNNDALPVDTFEKSAEERSKIIGEWFGRVGRPDGKLPLLYEAIKELKEKEGIESIGVSGYCYGGRIAVKLAATNEIKAAAVHHPAPLQIPSEIEEIQIPTIWICAEVDSTFPQDARKATQEILEKRGMKAIFKDYPGTEHGFAIRGDESNEVVYKAKIDALTSDIEFFKNQL